MPERWTPLTPHPEQLRLVNENRRFPVIPAGRRSGKTERFKRKLVKEWLRTPGGLFFAAAPTRDQVKKIYWKDIKALAPDWFKTGTSEGNLILYGKNGAEIHLLGLDRPERIEGIPWTGGGIDEIADIKADAWGDHIRPALSTKGLNTWCWLLGVPDGLNHYYEMAEAARTGAWGDEWGLYTWHSADILDPKEIAEAKRTLDPRTYRQEYEASFETATGRVYDTYGDENRSDREFSPDRPILWCHDFNYVPLSSAIVQTDDQGNDHVVDEIILEGAVAANAADEFTERFRGYERCPVILYGDASGRAGEKHGHASDYIEIEQRLARAGFEVERRVPAANPPIKDGQNSLRGRILNAAGERHLFVNPVKAPTVHKGLGTTQLMKGSAYQEDEKNKAQHVTTALRYFTAIEYPATGPATVENF